MSSWKRKLLFFSAGLLFALGCGVIQVNWMRIVPYEAFVSQPAWLEELHCFVIWLPWLAFGAVLALRIVKGRRIHAGSYVLGTAAPMMILLGGVILGPSIARRFHRQSFDAELWRQQGSARAVTMWPPRLCMADSLTASGCLDGLTRDQVLQLLGPSESSSWPLGSTSCGIHYYLGPERGFIRIDSEWLLVSFRDDDIVDRYWLYRD